MPLPSPSSSSLMAVAIAAPKVAATAASSVTSGATSALGSNLRPSNPSEPHREPELIALLSPPHPSSVDDALFRLNLGAFWQWALCFCIANFDLELGQSLELVYPPVVFTDPERRSIAFSAFPDSNSAEHLGDSCFTFRMRHPGFCDALYNRQKAPPMAFASSSFKSNSISTPSTTAASAAVIADTAATAAAASSAAAAAAADDCLSAPRTPEPLLSDSNPSTHAIGLPVDTDGFIYGYVFFRQQQDAEVRRGYLQKSLVLLSPHPWPGLFLYVVSLLGPEIMASLVADRRTTAQSSASGISKGSSSSSASGISKGNSSSGDGIRITNTGDGGVSRLAFQGMALLESACANIALWPAPPSSLLPDAGYCSVTYAIPFLGRVQRVSFPPNPRFPQFFDLTPAGVVQSGNASTTSSTGNKSCRGYTDVITAGTTLDPPILCTFAKLYQLFARSLDSLWVCWELMVTGEPILVVGDTPRACSDVVWALVELIKPIPYGGDYRPYFTIQDSDFKAVKGRSGQPPLSIVLGVTNMVFQRLLCHWPHTIHVSGPSASSGSMAVSAAAAAVAAASAMQQQRTVLRSTASTFTSPSLHSNANASGFSIGVGSGGGTAATFATHVTTDTNTTSSTTSPVIDSVHTKHRPYLFKDKRLIKDVIEANARGHAPTTLNNMIRRHFVELTDRFLQPLNRYFDTLITSNPSHMTLSTLRNKPELRAFGHDSFLKTVEMVPPTLSVGLKRPVTDLYRSFTQSPNFSRWLHMKVTDATRSYRLHYFNTLCYAPIQTWARDKLSRNQDVECVDVLMRLRDELSKYRRFFVVEGDGGVRFADVPGLPSREHGSSGARDVKFQQSGRQNFGGVPSGSPIPTVQRDDDVMTLGNVLSHPTSSSSSITPPPQTTTTTSSSTTTTSTHTPTPSLDASPSASTIRKPTRRRTQSQTEFGIDITSLRVDNASTTGWTRNGGSGTSPAHISSAVSLSPYQQQQGIQPQQRVSSRASSTSSPSVSTHVSPPTPNRTRSPVPTDTGTTTPHMSTTTTTTHRFRNTNHPYQTDNQRVVNTSNTTNVSSIMSASSSSVVSFGGVSGGFGSHVLMSRTASPSPMSSLSLPVDHGSGVLDASTTTTQVAPTPTTSSSSTHHSINTAMPTTTTTSTSTAVSPTPLRSIGGFIPSCEQYAAMRSQLDLLLAVLPDDLRVSMSITNT